MTTSQTSGRLRVASGDVSGEVSWILSDSVDAVAVLVLGHGAGANMYHASMTSIATEFARRGVAVLRFNFPFLEGAKRPVDSRAVSTATIAAAVERARELKPDLPLFIGGHSFGGRMASHAMLDRDLGEVRGLVFCSFPLHPAGQPATKRADHLDSINVPMLFLSGTRDALAEPELLQRVIARLGARTELVWLETADHSYKVLKRSRTRSNSVFEELADAAVRFINRLC
jgi:predicted alpha/beta-hydrolase family hydrolase